MSVLADRDIRIGLRGLVPPAIRPPGASSPGAAASAASSDSISRFVARRRA